MVVVTVKGTGVLQITWTQGTLIDDGGPILAGLYKQRDCYLVDYRPRTRPKSHRQQNGQYMICGGGAIVMDCL